MPTLRMAFCELIVLVAAACAGSEPTAPPPPPTTGPDIAFLRYRSGAASLWVAHAGDSVALRVADVPRTYYLAYSWSPDGRKLAFVGGTDSASAGIYVVNVDGSGLARLTSDPAWTSDLAWSPDGTRIAFANAFANDGLRVMKVDGTGQVKVADNFSSPWPPDPVSWSPDGTRIAYPGASPDGGWPEIFVVNADGSGRTQVTHGYRGGVNCCGDENTNPSWSPDGTRIAYQHISRYAGDGKYYVHVIHPDGTGDVNLTPTLPIALYPTWSPVGGLLAFWSNDGSGPYEIYVTNVAGSSPLRVTSGSDYGACRYISWSADGSRLTYCAHDDVYAVGFDGRGVVNVTNDPTAEGEPAWSPKR